MLKAFPWLQGFVVVLQLFLAATSASARGTEVAGVALPPSTLVLVPGALSGVGTGGSIWYSRLCSPRSTGLNEWRVSFIKQLLRPTADQTKLLESLAHASKAARNAIADACPKEVIATGPSHLRVMERRLSGLLGALRIIRPPYEAFYNSLNSRQKALLNALGPSRGGWRW